jgi:hypothetical protein
MDAAPPEPTALAFELPAEVKAAKLRHQCTWEEAAYHVGLPHGMTASEVSTLCSRVRVYVEFQRRREARRMTEAELAVFRSMLGWKPYTAAWKVFEGFMRDRHGEWPLICGTALGATSAALAALAGEDVAEYRELAAHCARLCAELPEDWDPRPTERFPVAFPEDRKALYRATPFRRYTN